MIKFASTKVNGKAEKKNNEEEYKDYPIKAFSFDSIWAGKENDKQSKITRCIVISAYTDFEWIKKAIDYVEKNKNKKCIEFQIYLDYFASKYSVKEECKEKLIELNKKIKQIDPSGGIFLVKKGTLFHSKMIITQTQQHCKVVVGSINFTEKAFKENEEIALVDEFRFGEQNKYPHYTWQIELYIEKLKEISENVSSIQVSQDYSSLRSRLMDGKLYWKNNEYSPFAFNLNLPEKILNKLSTKVQNNTTSSLSEYLDTNFANSLSLKNLMDLPNENEIETTFKKIDGKWKSYSIETAYGFWVPREYFKEVKDLLSLKSKKKRTELENFCQQINQQDKDGKIKNKFNDFMVKLTNELDPSELMEENIKKIPERWNKWYHSLKERLGIGMDKESNTSSKTTEKESISISERYKNKLSQTFLEESVPDIWNDEFAREEFEDSLISTIKYYNLCKQRRPWILKQLLDTRNIDINDDESIKERLQNCKFILPKKNHSPKTTL